MKKKHFYTIFLFSSMCIGIILGGVGYRFFSSRFSKKNKAKAKIEQLLDIIDKEYVDAVNSDSIVEITANHILSQLDPFSTYIPKEDLKEIQDVMRGSYYGIGIDYYTYKDTLVVVKVLEGGPADKSNIKAGDRVLAINDKRIVNTNISNTDIIDLVKGEKNSKVLLEIFRKSTNKVSDVSIYRGDVPIKSVDVSMMLNDTLGYVKINRFAESTYKEFLKMSKNLSSRINCLILDLRDNGGGYMEPAIQIANEFLEKGSVIVKTIDKKGSEKITLASSDGKFIKKKLYVLINENTASASEIIAGAIQDNDRGVIVGERSYGKGLVQRERTLSDGSVVRLTTARYYTPSGRSIQKPYQNEQLAENPHLNERFQKGGISQGDSLKVDPSMIFRTKNNRIVYGGGGIVPDVYVKASKNHVDEALMILMKTSMVTYIVFQQIEENRPYFEKLSFNELINEIQTNPIYYETLKKGLQERNIRFQLDQYKDKIKFYLVLEFISQLLPNDDYYFWNVSDDVYVKDIMQNSPTYYKILQAS